MKPSCWWCCHPFEWESLHFPYAFKSNVFYTTGHFCSWECMKAYAIERNKLEECEYITLMRKRVEGKISATKRAPSRYVLDTFGGTMSIQEFRNGGGEASTTTLRIPGEVYQTHTVTSSANATAAASSASSAAPSSSQLKLKREKPLERTKSKLEKSLGIIRKCSAAVSTDGKGTSTG